MGIPTPNVNGRTDICAPRKDSVPPEKPSAPTTRPPRPAPHCQNPRPRSRRTTAPLAKSHARRSSDPKDRETAAQTPRPSRQARSGTLRSHPPDAASGATATISPLDRRRRVQEGPSRGRSTARPSESERTFMPARNDGRFAGPSPLYMRVRRGRISQKLRSAASIRRIRCVSGAVSLTSGPATGNCQPSYSR